MKDKLDILLDRLIKRKFRTVENAKKQFAVSAILDKVKDITLLTKKDKLKLIEELSVGNK